MHETVLKITNYDEILNVQNKRLLLVTGHEEIFSLDETKETKLAVFKDAKATAEPNYREADHFFDYIKEINHPNWFDLKKFFNYKQKRISSKRAKENLHSKEDFPLVNPINENMRPHRKKLPYCQSEIFPSTTSSQASFYRRWHNFSLPRFTIYRMSISRHSVASLYFDRTSSSLTMEALETHRTASEVDYEVMWRLNELLYQEGTHTRYCLKSHIRQHKEEHDILELLRLYTAGLKKAPQVYYDPAAKIKPSLKHVASLEVLESEKALLESETGTTTKSGIQPLKNELKEREHVKFEQKKSILPDFRYTGDDEFRIIVYEDEVPHLDFELDRDMRRKRSRKTESEESILKLRPNLRDVSVPEILSDINLIGMGDYKLKPEDIGKPVMLKFKNMPELLGWFRKINEKELELLSSSDTSGLVSSEDQVNFEVVGKPKRDLREIVVETPLVGLKKFTPPIGETGSIELKKLTVTTHDTILSIIPKSSKKDEHPSDSDTKDEYISTENVDDKMKLSFSLKKKPGLKNITYKTRLSQMDSLHRIKSSIVNEVVKKVTSYFSKDLKPKLEASIKDEWCRCGQPDPTTPNWKPTSRRKCLCTPKVNKGVSAALNDLSNDASSNVCCPPSGCKPNFSIFACPTMTYFRNTGVNANTALDLGSSGDSLLVSPFDCKKMMDVYKNLAKMTEEQMGILQQYQNLMKCDEFTVKKDIKFCKAIVRKEISTLDLKGKNEILTKTCEGGDSHIPADFSSHVSERIDNNYISVMDSSSSNDSIQSNLGQIDDTSKFENATKMLTPDQTINRMTSHKSNNLTAEDTYNVTDMSDFECYTNYVCTHSEQFIQISEELTSKKLKRQTCFTDLIKFERKFMRGSKNSIKSKIGLNNDSVENNSGELVILFKRDLRTNKSTDRTI